MSQSSAVKAGEAYVQLLLENKDYLKGVKSSMQRLGDFGGAMQAMGATMMKAGAAILAPIAAAVVAFTKTGSELTDMSQRTGVAADKLVELSYAADLTGGSILDVEKAIQMMLVQLHKLREGEKGAVAMFYELGLSASDFAGKSPDEQFGIIASKLNDISDAAKRVSLAREIFGKMGAGLLPMMKDLEKLRAEARREGLIPSEQAIKDADRLGDAFDAIKRTAHATVFEIGSAFAPMVDEAVVAIRNIVRATKTWVSQNHSILRSIGRLGIWLVAAGAAFFACGKGIIFAGNTLLHFGRLASLSGRLLALPLKMLRSMGGLLSPFTKGMRLIQQIFGSATKSISAGAKRITAGLQAAARFGGQAFAMIGHAAGKAGSYIAAQAMKIGSSIMLGIASGVKQSIAWVWSLRTHLSKLPAVVATAFNASVAAAQSAGQGIRYAITRPLDYIKALAPKTSAAIASAWINAKHGAIDAGQKIAAKWSAVASSIIERSKQAGASILGSLSQAGSQSAGKFSSALGVIKSQLSSLAAKAAPFWRPFADLAGAAANRVKSVWAPVGSAISAAIGRVVPLVRQDLGKLIGIATTAASGVVKAFAFTGPAIGRGLIAGVKVALSQVKSLAVKTAGGMRRVLASGASGVGRGITGALAGVGTLASLAGPLLGKFGEMLTIAPLVISSIAAIGGGLLALISPFGLVAAAVGGGLYAWTQYSETGKQTLASVLGFLGPIAKTFSDTFGAIKDAIVAGDLAMAGKIAITGLRVALLQGVSAISSAVGGKWGDFIGKIGAQLAGGDFSGAWKTAILGMASIWDGFVEGIVAVFTQAARAITEVWQTTVTGLGNWLLDQAANGEGPMGFVSRALIYPDSGGLLDPGKNGVDVRKEAQRSAQANAERRDALISDREKYKQLLKQAEENGGTATVGPYGDQYTSEDLQRLIKDRNESLGIKIPSFLETGSESINQQIGGTADSIRSSLDGPDRWAQSNTRESDNAMRQGTAGGAAESNAELDKAQQELDELKRKATEAAQKAREETKDEKAGTFDNLGDTTDMKRQVFGSFSAAAAMAAGNGESPTVKKLDSLDKKLEMLVTLDEKQTRISTQTKDAILSGAMLTA